MENEAKINKLMNDLIKEYQGFNYYQRAKFAIEQISVWQERFTEAKSKILRENIVDGTVTYGILSQSPEIEA
ncbi:MAG: hypothetical protein FIB08_10920 [Candidatus Methanoperedens sp.]|nr:hypothetical protein [Candidatus Methanoperedens sp.]